MGFRVTWIARHGVSSSRLLEAGNMRLTGVRSDISDIGYYMLPLTQRASNPWVVMIADGSKHYGELDHEVALRASAGGSDVIYFSTSDTVMCSTIRCYYNKKRLWSIDYDCSDDDAPTIYGTVPVYAIDRIAELRARQRVEDANKSEYSVDYQYGICADLGHALIGYRHNMDPQTKELKPFRELAQK